MRIKILLLFLICLTFFSPFFFKDDLLTSKDNDLGRTYIPLFIFFRDSVFSYKQIPLWRPDQMMGENFIGNPLSSLFYPGNIAFLIFPVKFASIFYLFIHFLLAGIFTYLLARSFKLSETSSFTAAIFYAFSTKMLLHFAAGHLTMIASFAYFPLGFLALRKNLTGLNFNWIIVGAFSLAFMYITYPTIFYYGLIFFIIYLFYHLLFKFLDKKKLTIDELVRVFKPLITMVVLMIGLTAIQLLPQLEFAPLSTRSQLRLEDVAIPLWNLKRFFTSLIFPYFNFSNLDQESFLYLGIVPTLLFMYGFWYLSNIKKLFLALIGLLTLLFVTGVSTPIFKIAYYLLPFLKYSRVTTRPWFVVALVVALIAAYALEKIKRKSIIYLAIIFFLAESVFIGYRKIQTISNLNFGNEALYQFLAKDRELFRVYCTTYCFNPQLISKYNIQILNGETPIQDAKFIKFLSQAGNYQYSEFAVIFPPYQVWQTENPTPPNSYFLGLSNVKYVASTYPITDQDFIYLDKFENIYLYQNKKFKPRVYFEDDNSEAKIVKYSPNLIQVKFQKDTIPKNLIFSENFYPGWFGFTDYQKYIITEKEPIFRKITVPSGTESLELKYQPESYLLGKTLTLATIVALLLWGIRRFKAK